LPSQVWRSRTYRWGPSQRRRNGQKTLGAKLVVVHGETIVEPVEPGTNASALISPYVDILAHPGLLTLDEARQAASHDVYLEVSARRGHSLTNGHIIKRGYATGASLILNSDAHSSWAAEPTWPNSGACERGSSM